MAAGSWGQPCSCFGSARPAASTFRGRHQPAPPNLRWRPLLSFITATTIGYSDFEAVTIEGQVLGGFIVFLELGLLGCVSARLTTYWIQQNDESARFERQMRSLRTELAEMHMLLERALERLGAEPAPQTGDTKRAGR